MLYNSLIPIRIYTIVKLNLKDVISRKQRRVSIMGSNQNLEVIEVKDDYCVCEMENGITVNMDYQSLPFEVKEGDNIEVTIYYKDEEKEEIDEIIVTGKNS